MSLTGLITADRQSVTRHPQASAGATAADSALPSNFSQLLLDSQQTPVPAVAASGQLPPQAAPQGGAASSDVAKQLPVTGLDLTLQWESAGLQGGSTLPPAGEELPPGMPSQPLPDQNGTGEEVWLWGQQVAETTVETDLAAQGSWGLSATAAAGPASAAGSLLNAAGGQPGIELAPVPGAPVPGEKATAIRSGSDLPGLVPPLSDAAAETTAAAIATNPKMIPDSAAAAATAATTTVASAAVDAAAQSDATAAAQPTVTIPELIAADQMAAAVATDPDVTHAPVSLLNEASQTIDIAERIRHWRGPVAAGDMQVAADTAAAALRLPVAAPGQLQVFAEQLQAAAPAADPASAAASIPASTVMEDSLPAAPARQDNAPLQQVRTAPAAAFNPHTFSQLGHALDQPQWGESFARHIALLTGQNVSSAQVQLDPPELGSLMVRINIVGDQASISFVSPHAHVRDSIEQNFDRLQNMLSEQGLDLVDVDVSDQSFSGRDGQAPEGGAEQTADRQRDAEVQTVAHQVGLVDYYI